MSSTSKRDGFEGPPLGRGLTTISSWLGRSRKRASMRSIDVSLVTPCSASTTVRPSPPRPTRTVALGVNPSPRRRSETVWPRHPLRLDAAQPRRRGVTLSLRSHPLSPSALPGTASGRPPQACQWPARVHPDQPGHRGDAVGIDRRHAGMSGQELAAHSEIEDHRQRHPDEQPRERHGERVGQGQPAGRCSVSRRRSR